MKSVYVRLRADRDVGEGGIPDASREAINELPYEIGGLVTSEIIGDWINELEHLRLRAMFYHEGEMWRIMQNAGRCGYASVADMKDVFDRYDAAYNDTILACDFAHGAADDRDPDIGLIWEDEFSKFMDSTNVVPMPSRTKQTSSSQPKELPPAS